MNDQLNIMVDLRVVQTGAWYRGMGRYTASFMEALPKTLPEGTRLIGLFDTDLKQTSDRIRAVQQMVPGLEVVSLPLKQGHGPQVEANNQEILTKWVKHNVKGSLHFLITSIFTFDYQPFLIPGAINSLICYDLIPFKRWTEFHHLYPVQEYFRRFKFFYDAEHLFVISQNVEADLRRLLRIKPDRITNIAGAAITKKLRTRVQKDQSEELEKQLKGLRYVLLPGGRAPQKNMYRAIAAFDLFNREFGDEFRLVITSGYPSDMVKDMMSLSSNIMLSGEVSSNTLKFLYEHAEVVLFPSLDEGLGLPVLEAALFGKAIACSDIPVFKELSDDFYFFDPYSIESIAVQLRRATVDTARHEDYFKRYKPVNEKFTWEKSAAIYSQTLSRIQLRKWPNHTRNVIVEFDSNFKSILEMGSLLEEYGSDRVCLWCDMLHERRRPNHKTPLIFRFMLPINKVKDIVDYKPSSPANRPQIIFTKSSYYSAYHALKSGGQIIGPSRLVSEAVSRFLKSTPIGAPSPEELSSIVEDLQG